MVNGKKTYYSISEVCGQTALEPHVLRYWESEFPQLRPKKNRAGNRAYRDKDIEIIKYIKYLLYVEQFTIPGAKKKLSETRDYVPDAQVKLNLPLDDGAAARIEEQESEESGVEHEQRPPMVSGMPDSSQILAIKKELEEILQFIKA